MESVRKCGGERTALESKVRQGESVRTCGGERTALDRGLEHLVVDVLTQGNIPRIHLWAGLFAGVTLPHEVGLAANAKVIHFKGDLVETFFCHDCNLRSEA